MVVVRREFMKLIALAAALLSVAGGAVAQDSKAVPKSVAAPSTTRVIQMQTAFSPTLPGSGESVRIFTRSVKHMTAGAVAIKILEPGRVAPTADMLDAIVAGDLEAAFTWSGYAASKAPVFNIFATVPFGLGPEDMASWMLEGDGSRIHHDAYDRLGVVGIPCGIQGPKGGGWFRGEVNTVADFKGLRLRYGKLAAEVVARLGAALGFDKLGLPYYLPGWQQPSAVLDFLMRKDKWAALPASLRAQIQTACQANIAWMLSRSPNVQGVALEKLKASGIEVREWSPDLLAAFRKNSEMVVKDLAERDADFAAALANQKAFIAQAAHWRALSRLP